MIKMRTWNDMALDNIIAIERLDVILGNFKVMAELGSILEYYVV